MGLTGRWLTSPTVSCVKDGKMINNDARNLVGCCGLYCGLCAKYQSKAPSRCLGCRLGENHSWCSIWSCCVKKHGFETCTECDEIFKCPTFIRRKVQEWIPAAENLKRIAEAGLESWLKEQKEKQALLEEMLLNYNEGRSMNLYCKVGSRMPVDWMKMAMKDANEKIASNPVNQPDVKSKARAFKAAINDIVLRIHINLD